MTIKYLDWELYWSKTMEGSYAASLLFCVSCCKSNVVNARDIKKVNQGTKSEVWEFDSFFDSWFEVQWAEECIWIFMKLSELRNAFEFWDSHVLMVLSMRLKLGYTSGKESWSTLEWEEIMGLTSLIHQGSQFQILFYFPVLPQSFYLND